MRIQALRLVQAGGQSPGEIARTLGISRETLRRWRTQAGEPQGQRTAPSTPVPTPVDHGRDAIAMASQEDLQRLHNDNQRLRAERTLLVEALAFIVMLVRGTRS